MKTIKVATYPSELYVFQGRLEAEGIPSFIGNENLLGVQPFYSHGELQVCNFTETVLCTKNLCGQGILSSAFFPLKISGQVIGIIGFNVEQTDFFREDEVKLLSELANDISLAIEINANERERKQTEILIKIQKDRLEMAQRIGHIGSWEYDPQSKIMWASDESFRIFGIALTLNSCVTLEAILECLTDRDSIQLALRNLIQHNEAFDMPTIAAGYFKSGGSFSNYLLNLERKFS